MSQTNGESTALLPSSTTVVVEDVSHVARVQTAKQAKRYRAFGDAQIRRNIVIGLVVLVASLAIVACVLLNTSSDFDGSYDGYKEAQALDSNHWLITDDKRGVVYGATFSNSAKHAYLQHIVEGMSAPNGMAVDTTNHIAYVTDSDSLQLYRVSFDLNTESGYNVDILEMSYLKPEMQYPKKALLHPDGTTLILADQTSNELYVVKDLFDWPDVSIITLTDDSTLEKPHGMTWLQSNNATMNFTIPPYGDSVAPKWKVDGDQYVSTAGILVANHHKVSFVRFDTATVLDAEQGNVQTPVDIVDLKSSFGLKHPDAMSVQFVPSGDGSLLVMSKNSCGVFLVEVRDGNINWADNTDRSDGFRITGHEDPGCTVNNPHGMTCRSEVKQGDWSNGCIVVQPGKYGGGKLAWLEVPRGDDFLTKSDYDAWDMTKYLQSSPSSAEDYAFSEDISWYSVTEL